MAIIAIDIDDVLIPFYASMAKWHNELHGTDLSHEQLTSNKLTSGWGGVEDYWINQCNIYHAAGHSAQIPISKEARGALEGLAKEHQLVLVTSRPSLHRDHTYDWVVRNVGDITKDLIMCDSFHPNGGTFHMNKGEIAQEIGAMYLIDDAPHYVESCAPTDVKGILFGDYSWNREHHDKHIHAKSWPEAVDIIKKG